MRHHNPLRQRGIGPSLACRVGIRWQGLTAIHAVFLLRTGVEVSFQHEFLLARRITTPTFNFAKALAKALGA